MEIYSRYWINPLSEFKQFGTFHPAGSPFLCCYSFLADSSRRRYITEQIKKNGKGNISLQIFTFQELCIATQNFNPDSVLGEGGFGRVYKGKLEKTNQVNSLLYFSFS